jgi:hypothetical protein
VAWVGRAPIQGLTRTVRLKRKHAAQQEARKRFFGTPDNPKTSAALFDGLSTRLKRLGYASYADYLKSEHWRAIKTRWLQSKRVKSCSRCGNPYFELHHKTYKRLGLEQLSDLIALCRECHESEHARLWDANVTAQQAARIRDERVAEQEVHRERKRAALRAKLPTPTEQAHILHLIEQRFAMVIH